MVLLSENSDKNDQNLLSAKNNDSLSEKRVIVKFYTPKYRKCGKFNSKNDSRPCMGAFAFLKSVDFKGICGKCKNDSTGEIFVSIWTRNMMREDGSYSFLLAWNNVFSAFSVMYKVLPQAPR